jgi:hypothetical protein
MYTTIFLDKENDLNKILKDNKRDPQDMSVLFVSQWDEMCGKLQSKLLSYADVEEGEPLYVVDSFNMPHSFVIFKTTKVPHLVQFRKDEIISEDYYPMILKNLGFN